jgi:hypothetical protein
LAAFAFASIGETLGQHLPLALAMTGTSPSFATSGDDALLAWLASGAAGATAGDPIVTHLADDEIEAETTSMDVAFADFAAEFRAF